MRWIVVMLCLASGAALAQDAQDPKESLLHAELRREGERVSDRLHVQLQKPFRLCGYTLFTGPSAAHRGRQHACAKRIRTGRRFRLDQEHKKLAAQLGCGRDRSISGGAWRAGGYMKLIHTPHPTKPVIEVVIPTPGEKPKASEKKKVSAPFTHPYTVFNLYAQSISLNKLNYFGEGNDTTLAGASVFG